MTSRFDMSAAAVCRLAEAIRTLDAVSCRLELSPLRGREWFELLHRKLIPQLGDESFLIVGVCGGTNIGKSVIFNHVAGSRVSSTSPLASGTRHPIALIPAELARHVSLKEFFPGFQWRPWEHADQPLMEDDRHLLFFRECPTLPDNLIVLDTPDVDSVAEVNWERAAHVRQSADVLIAVLTQQKYNDAAVKEFFRKAAQEDKLVIVVFNQCLLPDDEGYWPLWLQTFCDQTGVTPHAVYLAPHDRRAAESNTLPFFERVWPAPTAETAELEASDAASDPSRKRSLLADLSDLRFGEIKLRTLTGALQQILDDQHGIPSWLEEIRGRADEFCDALAMMSSERLVEIARWPVLPNSAMVAALRIWWRRQREGWTATVHDFYHRLGDAVVAPLKLLRNRTGSERVPPLETYREREWETVLQALNGAVDRLVWLRDLGHPLLSERLDRLLGGESRAEFINRLRENHARVDFEAELDTLIEQELAHFREESPQAYKLMRRVDTLAAATRPVVSVALFMTGAGPVGDVLMPAVAESALQGAFHVAGNAVGGTVMTVVGDKFLSEGTSSGMAYLEARFRRLHVLFARQRTEWLAKQLEEHLFGGLPAELSDAAGISEGVEFEQVQGVLRELRGVVEGGEK